MVNIKLKFGKWLTKRDMKRISKKISKQLKEMLSDDLDYTIVPKAKGIGRAYLEKKKQEKYNPFI